MAWNRPIDRNQLKKPLRTGNGHRNAVVYGGIVGAIAIVVGIFALLVLGKTDNSQLKPSVETSLKRIKEVKPHLRPNVPAETNAVETPKKIDPSKIRVKTISIVTNKMGNVIDRYLAGDGKIHKSIRLSRPPIFNYATDDLLSLAFAQNGNGSMPPMPLVGDLDKEFLMSIREPIIIEETDSEDVKERKRRVREARLEIKKLMDEGLHFRDILAEHEKIFNENAEIRGKAIAEARKIRDEGDTEGTAQYVEAMNAAFETMGIDKIEMPKSKEEREIERELRRAAREERMSRIGDKK